MDRDKLVALAAKVEAAERGSSALDEEIGRALAGPSGNWIGRPYSTSMDAAMTLIPEGWAISSLSVWPASPEDADNARPAASSVDLVQSSLKRMGRQRIWGHGSDDRKASGNAADAPRAITAAALRALASTPREGDGL